MSAGRELDVDVLVAGAGAAGCSAALRAAEQGATVALVERSEHFRSGNNTSMSTSMVPAGGSRWQADAGVDDSPECFAADVARKTKGTASPALTATLTGVAPELVAWLADSCGVPLGLVTDFVYPGHSRPRCHSVPDRSGRALLDHLLAAIDEREQVTLAVPMRLDALEPLAGGGWRAGVRPGAAGDGAAEEITAGAVVLASGGFGADPALVARYTPEIAGALYHGGDGCRGDALRLGGELGADVGFLDAYQGHGSVAVPQAIIVTWAVIMHGGVILNTAGRRFGDETIGYSEYGALVVAQPGGEAFVVLDGRIDAACKVFADYQAVVESGALRWADDAEQLAALIGAPVEAVAGELDDLAALAAGKSGDRYGRARPEQLLRPPYGAVRVTGALFHTQGGMLVGPDAEVLRGGKPIAGLYAAGGAAAGISGHGASGYLAGNGLLGALGLGYLAGRHAGRRS